MTDEERKDHADYQREFFDEHFQYFKQPIPEDVRERTAYIVKSADLTPGSRVLDVGTGMGVLIEYILGEQVRPENVLGCDLSTNMLAQAKAKYPGCRFWQGDILELELPDDAHLGRFNAIFFNACFGNLFDQEAVLRRMKHFLEPGGKVIISHPLGNKFVQQLKDQDERLVLKLLPRQDELSLLSVRLGYQIVHFADEDNLYLAILQAQ